MKIIFINPSYFTPEEASAHREMHLDEIRSGNMYFYPFEPPVGIASIAAYLSSEGHETGIIDMQGDNLSVEEVLDILRQNTPDVIGITAMTPTVRKALDLSKTIKEKFPQVPIIFGGVHPTVSPGSILSREYVDYAVRGEGEEVLSKFLKQGMNNPDGIQGLCWKGKDGIPVITDRAPLIKDINLLPLPDYSSFPVRKYIDYTAELRGLRGITMMVTRGCPYHCTFCAVRETMGKKWRKLDPENAARWMIHVCENYDLEGIWFKDSTFNIDRKWTNKFAETLISLKNKYIFQINTRVDLIRDDEIALLKRAGLVQVDMGIESGSPRSLEILKKNITIEQIYNSVATLKTHGLKVSGFFMIGIPGETEEDISQTAELVKTLELDRGSLSIYTPLPGSELYNILDSQGKIKNDPEFFEYHHFTEARESYCDVSIERLRELQGEIHKYFSGNSR